MTVGFFGLPVAIVAGSMFAPVLVTASRQWLAPVTVGIAIAAALMGWLLISAVIVAGGILLAPVSGGGSLAASLGLVAASLAFLGPALVFVLPIVAVWAVLVRTIVWWRQRNPKDRADG